MASLLRRLRRAKSKTGPGFVVAYNTASGPREFRVNTSAVVTPGWYNLAQLGLTITGVEHDAIVQVRRG